MTPNNQKMTKRYKVIMELFICHDIFHITQQSALNKVKKVKIQANGLQTAI